MSVLHRTAPHRTVPCPGPKDTTIHSSAAILTAPYRTILLFPCSWSSTFVLSGSRPRPCSSPTLYSPATYYDLQCLRLRPRHKPSTRATCDQRPATCDLLRHDPAPGSLFYACASSIYISVRSLSLYLPYQSNTDRISRTSKTRQDKIGQDRIGENWPQILCSDLLPAIATATATAAATCCHCWSALALLQQGPRPQSSSPPTQAKQSNTTGTRPPTGTRPDLSSCICLKSVCRASSSAHP